MCGYLNHLPDGTPGQCDPDGNKPCCSNIWYGDCGNTAEHCSCSDCTNYTRLYKEWEESGGTQKWRYDGRCGSKYLLPDGTPGQCDPDGDRPCCSKSEFGWCSNMNSECICIDCNNYGVVKKIQKTGENCTLAQMQSGFLKRVCFDDVRNRIYYKCIHSNESYKAKYRDHFISVSEVCDNDPNFYQACGFNTEITNTAQTFCVEVIFLRRNKVGNTSTLNVQEMTVQILKKIVFLSTNTELPVPGRMKGNIYL